MQLPSLLHLHLHLHPLLDLAFLLVGAVILRSALSSRRHKRRVLPKAESISFALVVRQREAGEGVGSCGRINSCPDAGNQDLSSIGRNQKGSYQRYVCRDCSPNCLFPSSVGPPFVRFMRNSYVDVVSKEVGCEGPKHAYLSNVSHGP